MAIIMISSGMSSIVYYIISILQEVSNDQMHFQNNLDMQFIPKARRYPRADKVQRAANSSHRVFLGNTWQHSNDSNLSSQPFNFLQEPSTTTVSHTHLESLLCRHSQSMKDHKSKALLPLRMVPEQMYIPLASGLHTAANVQRAAGKEPPGDT